VIGLAGNLEQRVLRRTRIVVAVNLAAAIGLVVLLVSGIAYLVSANQQDTATQRYVGIALAQDSGGIKYSCLWLFTMPAGQAPYPSVKAERIEGAAAAPLGFPLLGPMRSVAAGGPPAEETVVGNRTVYLVRTVRVGGQVRQAVFDLAYQRDNNRQLVVSLLIAGLAGLAVAGALGLVLSRRAVRPLEEALDRQRRFVTDASHELRAPITRLHTRAQLLLAEAGLPAAVVADLHKMIRGTGELTEVVDDLLRSARLRAGAQPADRVDLVALIEELVAAEDRHLQDRQVSAEVRAGPARPAVAGVESSLRRMLSVLVDNAIGHSRQGGRIEVSVAAVDQDRTVELVVADDGVGLDPGSDHKIFDRFVRGTAGEGPRHGLGLALAREVVDSHHGTISASGEPGGGARFVVRLPAAKPIDEADSGP
jgi:signal transduction histidine kinase